MKLINLGGFTHVDDEGSTLVFSPVGHTWKKVDVFHWVDSDWLYGTTIHVSRKKNFARNFTDIISIANGKIIIKEKFKWYYISRTRGYIRIYRKRSNEYYVLADTLPIYSRSRFFKWVNLFCNKK